MSEKRWRVAASEKGARWWIIDPEGKRQFTVSQTWIDFVARELNKAIDAERDAARYEEIKEILLTGGSVSYSGGSGEFIIRDILGNESRCAGGLGSMLDERIERAKVAS